MNLEVQIQTLISSFVFGYLFAFIFNLLYQKLFLSKKIYKIIYNIILVYSCVILYFLMLYLINGGVLHLYFLFTLLGGYAVGNIFSRKLRRNKWFTPFNVKE